MYEANQGRGRRSNTLVVPQANNALQQLKYEAAQELGDRKSVV